jgi:hypothetical protein
VIRASEYVQINFGQCKRRAVAPRAVALLDNVAGHFVDRVHSDPLFCEFRRLICDPRCAMCHSTHQRTSVCASTLMSAMT